MLLSAPGPPSRHPCPTDVCRGELHGWAVTLVGHRPGHRPGRPPRGSMVVWGSPGDWEALPTGAPCHIPTRSRARCTGLPCHSCGFLGDVVGTRRKSWRLGHPQRPGTGVGRHLEGAGCPWDTWPVLASRTVVPGRPAPPPTAFLESQSRVSAGPGPEAPCGFRLRPFLSFLSL